MTVSPATRYAADFELARTDPAAFWGREAGHIRWMSEPESVLDARAAPFYSWYVGATLNTCDNCVDRHVDAGRPAKEGRGGATSCQRVHARTEHAKRARGQSLSLSLSLWPGG